MALLRNEGEGTWAGQALLRSEEVAAYFGVERTTVYRWCREGCIPCLKIGKHWRFRREDLEAFLEEDEVRQMDRLPATEPPGVPASEPSSERG